MRYIVNLVHIYIHKAMPISPNRAPTMDAINLWEDLHHSNDKLSLKNAIDKFTINPLKVSQVSHVENLLVLVQIHNEKKLPLW